MKELTAPNMRPTTVKLLTILSQIDQLSSELYRVAEEAENEDGERPFTVPDWDTINDHFGQWYDGWLTYIFDRMRGHFLESKHNEL